MSERPDYQQQEAEAERWTADVDALIEAYRKGVSQKSLATLCHECGIPLKFITEEVRTI